VTIEDLKRLEAAAGPAPWDRHGRLARHIYCTEPDGYQGEVCSCDADDDVALIAALRNSAPALLACAELVAEMAECDDVTGNGQWLNRAATLMAAFKASP